MRLIPKKKNPLSMSKSKIFYGGPIITMNDKEPTLEAVGIKADKIVATGSLTDVRQKLPKAELIDLKGHCLLPGFHDCHCHALAYVFFFSFLNLRHIKNYSDFLYELSEIAKKSPFLKVTLNGGLVLFQISMQFQEVCHL